MVKGTDISPLSQNKNQEFESEMWRLEKGAAEKFSVTVRIFNIPLYAVYG